MANPPTSPFCTAAQISYLCQNLFRGQTPTSGTPVTVEVIEDYIIPWVDSMIEMQFQSVGYKVPFLTLAGEAWPTHQTTWLQFISATGGAAMAGGYILKPAPAMAPGRVGSPKGVYAQMIDELMREITKSGFHFRAQYYDRTKAEKWLATPYGPRTDFWQDLWDPTRYELVRGYTKIISELFDDMQEMDINWDYFYSIRTGSGN